MEQYWLEKLSGEIVQGSFAADNIDIGSREKSQIYFELSKEISNEILKICGGSNYAVFMILLSGVKYLLYRYTGNEDLVIGTPILKDIYEEGMVNNVLAIRSNIKRDASFKELLLYVRNNVQDAAQNQNIPYEHIINLLGYSIDKNVNPLFNTMVLLENIQAKKYVENIYTDTCFAFSINNGIIGCSLEYIESKLKNDRVMQLQRNLINVYKAAVQNMDIKLQDIDIHSTEDKQKILYEFNNNHKEEDLNMQLYTFIEQHAEKTPHKTAVLYGEQQISYRELNEGANRLARFLSKHKVSTGCIAAIIMDRTPLMLQSILALWKLGAAYIPLDPDYPEDRISSILSDSNCHMILSISQYSNRIADENYQEKVVLLDEKIAEIQDQDKENLYIKNSLDNLAYVIYTSGSTGKPKGAMIEQMGMLNHILAKIEDLGLDSSCVIAQNASQCFDISVWQFFCALAAGGQTVIYPNRVVSDLKQFTQAINKDKVTIMEVVPSFLGVLLEHMEIEKIALQSITNIIVTGEVLPLQLVKRWFNLYPHIKMVNAYGPTEASDDITHYIMEAGAEYEDVPIGKPLRNFNIYIVDNDMNLCPIGVKGEIYVSGLGVGRGYLNNAALTEAAFLPRDIFKNINARMYKTGDLGCRLNDGHIRYFGRKDHQVKLRGFRIELGEIEKALLKLRNVKEAVALLCESLSGDKYICAYLVAQEKLDKFEIRKSLSEYLPEYMIPAYYVYMDKMPLSANGKVDRKAFPKPDFKSEEYYEAPQNDVQKKLVEVWEEVLDLKNIGINDDFFEIGGDSIKAIQISAILQRVGLKLENADLFLNPTIKKVEGFVKKLDFTVEQGMVEGSVLLTPIQKKFFERNYTDSSYYNQAVLLYGKEGFDKDMVIKVFDKLIEKHDALRMTFVLENGQVMQRNRGAEEDLYNFFQWELDDSLDIEEQIVRTSEEVHNSLNIYGGPLVSIALYKARNDGYLLISIHHLVIDGISWRILLEDFEAAYEQMTNNLDIELSPKTTSYKDWSNRLEEYAKSTAINKELDYWKTVKEVEYKPLPKDYVLECEQRKVENIHGITVTLNGEMTDKLIKESNWAYSTETYDILLTALGITLNMWCNMKNILVSMEGHGREAIIKDIDINRTIGWYTSIYPVAIELKNAEDIAYSIKHVKEILRGIPNKGIGYGLLRYLALDNDRDDNSLNIDPEICFNYLGQFDKSISSKSLFELSSMNIGNTISPRSEQEFSLEVICLIVDGSLNISFKYNTFEYKKERIVELANCYISNLRKLINHCTGISEKQLTPSDVSEEEDLTIEQLDSITASLNL